jgi:hypothetical protein
MSKKEKTIFVLAENFKAMIAVVPKLEAFLKVHNEIAEGYQKYRKNGGAAIPSVEKHLGAKIPKNTVKSKTKSVVPATEVKAPKESTGTKKVNKKVK